MMIVRKMLRFTDGGDRFEEVIRKTANITEAGGLGEEFAEDFEGVYIDRGFGMIFYVAEDLLRYFVSDCSVQRDQHAVCKREGHEFLHYRIMLPDKRHKIMRLRTEAKGHGQLEKKTDMEIAEVGLDRVEEEDVFFTPFEKALLVDPILDHTVQDLAHEHRHGVLEHVVPYAQKRVSGNDVAGSEQCGLARFEDIGLQHIQRQEKGHHGLLSCTLYKKASPPIIPAQGMDDERILTELGGMKNYESGVLGHTLSV